MNVCCRRQQHLYTASIFIGNNKPVFAGNKLKRCFYFYYVLYIVYVRLKNAFWKRVKTIINLRNFFPFLFMTLIFIIHSLTYFKQIMRKKKQQCQMMMSTLSIFASIHYSACQFFVFEKTH